MATSSLNGFQADQKNLVKDIKICNEDLVQLRKASYSLIRKSENAIQQSFAQAFTITEKLVKLIETADRDVQSRLDWNEWTNGGNGDAADYFDLIADHSEFIAEKYHQDFATITNGFEGVAEISKKALEFAQGLSRDATIFQVTRVASVEQQRQTVLKNLEIDISTTKQKFDILNAEKNTMASQMALENHKASTSGQEALRQDGNRDGGIITGSVTSGALAYTTLGVGLAFGPVGWLIGGLAVASSATTTAIYASEKKERIQRLQREQRDHQIAAARLGEELSQASSAMTQLEYTATGFKEMGRELTALGKDVDSLRHSAASHEHSMKQSVMKSTNTYFKMSQIAIKMAEVGYSFDVRQEILQLVSEVRDELNLLEADRGEKSDE